MKESNIEDPNPIPDINTSAHLNEEMDENHFNENYLPNLATYQKIEVKYKGKVDPIILTPVAYYSKLGKGYYVFNEDNFGKIVELFQEELKSYLQQHNIVLHFKEDNLNNSLNSADDFSDKPDENLPISKLFSQFVAYWGYKNIINYANFLGTNLTKLNKLVKDCSDKNCKYKLNMLFVSENLFDNDIKTENFGENEKWKNYTKYLKEIDDIKDNKAEDLDKLNLIYNKIGEFKKEINPENSTDNQLLFSLLLNELSNYLLEFEKGKETKGQQLVKIMDINRRTLDFLLIENRFKYIENQSPILNTRTDRYHILNNSINEISIYLGRGEAIKYLKDVRKEIERKSRNIEPKYQFQNVDLDNIIEVAKSIDFKKIEDLTEHYQNKIKECQSSLQLKNLEFVKAAVIDTGIKIIKFKNKNLSKINLIDGGKTISLSLEQISGLLLNEKKNLEKEDKKEEKNTKCNENKKEKEEKKEEVDNSDEVEEKKNLEKKKKILAGLGINSKGFSEEIVDSIFKAFKICREMNDLDSEIKKLSNIKNKIEEKYAYCYEFVNALKLYNELIKQKLELKDYKGIILTEINKEKAKELREYKSRKL